MRGLFLDIDGVLNRERFRPEVSVGLRSWIEPELAARLCEVIEVIGVEIVLSSDWRRGREIELLRGELLAAGIGPMIDVTREIHGPRWREIEAWMREHGRTAEQIAIVDDFHDMGPLAARFVRVSPLNGLDEDAARKLVGLFES